MQAVKEEEEEDPPPLPAEAPPRPPAAAPVSKWTLVDYDEDNPPADLEGCAVTFTSCTSYMWQSLHCSSKSIRPETLVMMLLFVPSCQAESCFRR